MSFKKNTAVTGFPFTLVAAADGSAITTGTPVGYVTLDGGTQTAIGDVTPVHEGNGQWTFDLTAAEMNGDVVGFLVTHTSAINAHFTMRSDTKIVSELNDFNAASDDVAVVTTLTNKTGFSLSATGLDAIASTATGVVEIAKAIWDRVLSAANHNIANSAGRRVRQLQDSGSYAAGGAMVYLDTVNGIAGTTLYENGTITNAVDSIADALTIMGNLPADQIHVSSGSTFAPVVDILDKNIYGVGYACTLGGNDFAGTHIYHASPMNGIATTAGAADHFDVLDSIINVMTSDDIHFTRSIFLGTYTFGTSGIVTCDVKMNYCVSGIDGAGSPVFTKTAGATLNLSVRDFKGGFTLNGLESGDSVTLGGTELGTITLNGADASVEIRGIYKSLVDNLTGSPTVNTDGAIKGVDVASTLADTNAILVDTGTTIPAILGTPAGANMSADIADLPTVAELEVRTPTAAQLAYITRHAATALPVTFTGGTTTTAILGNVDGSAASSTDDVYNSRLLVFNAGTLDEQVCQITDYVGSTTTATISAVTTAVTASHTAVLV